MYLQALEDRFHLSHGQQPLLRSFRNKGRLSRPPCVRPSNDNFVVFVVVVVLREQSFICHMSGNNLHFRCVLFGGAADLLQVFVIAVLGQPSDDVLVRPIDLQGPGVLIENVILCTGQ